MSFEQRDNSGALFKNEKKSHDNQPDYQGECKIDGQTFRMSAWIKRKEGGRTWMSFSFTPWDKDGRP